MPELDENATFLIATSWQALNRATDGDEKTLECNCTIVILFAYFFIEANLTQIIKKMGRYQDMTNFLGNKNKYPGLFLKLGWFYNEFISSKKAKTKSAFFDKTFELKLDQEFSGFSKLHDFRNGVAHGVIKRSLTNLDTAIELRINAKKIVDKLFQISKSEGFDIPRLVTYEMSLKV